MTNKNEELSQIVIDAISDITKDWAEKPRLTDIERCRGVVHSIIWLMDMGGCKTLGTVDFPGFELVASIEPEDADQSFKGAKLVWPLARVSPTR